MAVAPRCHDLPADVQALLDVDPHAVQILRADYDAEGVWFYQAYRSEIAEHAVAHQQFGGPLFNPTRMTWIKPSFGWMLYRCGYGAKPGQDRVLRVKLAHAAVAEILSHASLSHGVGEEDAVPLEGKQRAAQAVDHEALSGGAPKSGRVQWDPERDVEMPEISAKAKLEPRKMLRTRAIQIGLAGGLSAYYVAQALRIEDVTGLARAVGDVHRLARSRRKADRSAYPTALAALRPRLPNERPYLPECSVDTLRRLGMFPGPAATYLAGVGRGHLAPA